MTPGHWEEGKPTPECVNELFPTLVLISAEDPLGSHTGHTLEPSSGGAEEGGIIYLLLSPTAVVTHRELQPYACRHEVGYCRHPTLGC